MLWAETPGIPIYEGLRLTLTRNENKEKGFVNGMGCTVRAARRHGIEVVTDMGTVLVVHPVIDTFRLGGVFDKRVKFWPVRLGYAVNLNKVQGQTMDHVTIWLDKKNVPAAGYVALSRVRTDADWRFIGYLEPHHFTPASNV